MMTGYFERLPQASSSGVDERDRRPELLDRLGHLVADAHDVADRPRRRGLQVHDLHARFGRVKEQALVRVRILDDLKSDAER